MRLFKMGSVGSSTLQRAFAVAPVFLVVLLALASPVLAADWWTNKDTTTAQQGYLVKRDAANEGKNFVLTDAATDYVLGVVISSSLAQNASGAIISTDTALVATSEPVTAGEYAKPSSTEGKAQGVASRDEYCFGQFIEAGTTSARVRFFMTWMTSINLSSPPPIGDVTPNTGEFTTVEATNAVVLPVNGTGIRADTADGSDNQYVYIAGGGDQPVARGGRALLFGNEYGGGISGSVYLDAGNVPDGDIAFRTGSTIERMRIDNAGNVTIANDLAIDGNDIDIGDAGGFSGFKFNSSTTQIEFWIDGSKVGHIGTNGAYVDDVP